jgi:orotidine-5'-phosphate decarboxylase
MRSSPPTDRARGALALAADLPLPQAEGVARAVTSHVGVVKVGLSLFVEHGPHAVQVFRRAGMDVFLDLKLHDIPNTVELAAAKAVWLGVQYLTVHAGGGRAMLEAARRGVQLAAEEAKVAPPRILAVTVLTSMDDEALRDVGVSDAPAEQVKRLATLAREAGITGLVCSGREVPGLRALLGRDMFLCTPGIRPHGAAKGDQARTDTPGAAIAAGSDLLVVGRPIYEAGDPAAAAESIHLEISSALA